MESTFAAADRGTTSSADCGTASAADCGTASGSDCRTTSGGCGADLKGDTGGDCGADSGKDCTDTKDHLTDHDYKYTDFAAGSQTVVAGPSTSSKSKTQPDTSSPEELQLREERIQARAQKKEERKEKTRNFLNSAKTVAENIIKGKF
jgi:hypothetical protein